MTSSYTTITHMQHSATSPAPKADTKAADFKILHESKTSDIKLRGLSTPTGTIAWVSGEKGTYARTVDSGTTWDFKRMPDDAKNLASDETSAKALDFRDIKAFDDKIAYIMSIGFGTSSRIYKTTDGGASWKLQLKGSDANEFFDCMAFWDRDHGMLLSDPVDGKFKLYLTEDGGDHWTPTPLTHMPVASEGEGAFAASGSCMAVQGTHEAWFVTGQNTARVFHTLDRGMHWDKVETTITHNSDTAGIFSIKFFDNKRGVISGGDHKNPNKEGINLATTNDGGKTWQPVAATPQLYLSAAAYTPDADAIMVAGPNQVALVATDDLTQWKKVWDVSNQNALSIWSKQKALTVGNNETIVEYQLPQKPIIPPPS